jgi:hypothetical protein
VKAVYRYDPSRGCLVAQSPKAVTWYKRKIQQHFKLICFEQVHETELFTSFTQPPPLSAGSYGSSFRFHSPPAAFDRIFPQILPDSTAFTDGTIK